MKKISRKYDTVASIRKNCDTMHKGVQTSILLIHALLVFVRFDINWIRDKNLRVYENIDCHPSLTRKEKQYLKGIHLRHKGEDLPKGPSLTDLHELRKAYGEIYVYMHQSIPLTTDSELYECDVMNYVHHTVSIHYCNTLVITSLCMR